MSFPADRWGEVETLFERALDCPAAEREAFLDVECGRDAELRSEVASLLAADAGAGEGLGAVARSVGDAAAALSGEPSEIVGRFRLIRELGRGGMGVVHLAERADGEFEQRVALKLLPPGTRSPAAHRRFLVERQALARLDHPAIARLLDGGTTPDGRPYLVMELVEGERIDRWCEGRPLEERLRLVLEVCNAVESAHRAGVVHRDLKPSNILVTAKGRPKLLDFGIAKMLSPAAHDPELAATVTLPSALAFTPEYASPEQVRGEPVTAAADVYALGLLLYRLLTGVSAQPWEPDTGQSLEEAVCRRDPEPPSVVVARTGGSGDGEESAVTAAELEGDLDRIVLRAVRKEPDSRYASVGELSDDLERWIAGRPVRARRGVWRYRLRRTARRHPAGVAALVATLVTAALGAGALFVAVDRDGAATAASVLGQVGGPAEGRDGAPDRPMAAAEPRRSAAVLDFRNLSGDPAGDWLSNGLAEMLRGEIAAGEALRVVPGDEVVRGTRGLVGDGFAPSTETVTRLAGRLDADVVLSGTFLRPEGGGELRVDCRVLDASGDALAHLHEVGSDAEILGIVSRLGARLREILGVAPLSPGEQDALDASRPGNPQATRRYAFGLDALRRFDALRARDLLLEATVADPAFPLASPPPAPPGRQLGSAPRALEASRLAFDRAPGLPRSDRLAIEAAFHEASQDWEQAIGVQQTRATLFPDDPEIALDLARVQTLAGRPDDALVTLDELEVGATRTTAGSVPDPRVDLARAQALGSRSDFDGQLAAARRAAETARARNDSLIVARARLAEWWALRNLGQLEAATTAAEEAGELFAEAGDRGGVGRALNARATTLADQGRFDEATALDLEGLEIFRAIEDRRRVGWALNNLARRLSLRGDREGARRMIEETLEIAREVGDASAVARAQAHLGRMHLEDGELEAAEELHRLSLEGRRAIGEDRGVAGAVLDLALVRLARGELARAVGEIGEAADSFLELGDRQSAAHGFAFLGDALLATGDLDGAREAFDRSRVLREELGAASVALSRLGAAEVDLVAGEPAVAADVLDELLRPEVRSALGREVPKATALRALARRELGDAEGARDACADAAEELRRQRLPLAERLDVELLLARAGGEVDLARVLREARDAGLPKPALEAELVRLELGAERATTDSAGLRDLAERAWTAGYGGLATRADRAAGFSLSSRGEVRPVPSRKLLGLPRSSGPG